MPRIPRATGKADPERDLTRAIGNLEQVVVRFPEQYPHIFRPGRELMFTYLKGIVYGLGALTAVAIVIPLLVTLLQQIQWVPLIGDFTEDVLHRIEQSQQ